MKQKLSSFIVVLLIATVAKANGVDVNGINYILDSSTKTASVTYKGQSASSENKYSGIIVIPSSIYYNGTKYYVNAINNT